jgi:hypothetical protein
VISATGHFHHFEELITDAQTASGNDVREEGSGDRPPGGLDLQLTDARHDVGNRFGIDPRGSEVPGQSPGDLNVTGHDDKGRQACLDEALGIEDHPVALAAVGAAREQDNVRCGGFEPTDVTVVQCPAERDFDACARVERGLPRGGGCEVLHQPDRRYP